MVNSACVALAASVAWAGTVCGATVHRRDSVPAGYVAAPYYPSPLGGWTSDWTSAYEKAESLVSSMTLAEKTNITAGTGFFMGRFQGLFIIFCLLVLSWSECKG
jgi:beta-glucosidase